MLICDICKKEKRCNSVILPYTYQCKSFQTKIYDLCNDCAKILADRKTLITIAFIENKTEQEILKELYLKLPLREEGEQK